MSRRPAADYHTSHHFATGIGHIEADGAQYRASFYGRRVAQAWAATVRDARRALGELARADHDAR